MAAPVESLDQPQLLSLPRARSRAEAEIGMGDVLTSVTRQIERLDELQQLIAGEEGYRMPPLDYELPAGFLLSVVVPVFNERATIGRILARIAAMPLPLEIVVVDDASTDGTRDVLKFLETIPNLRVLYHRQNQGKGAAVRDGFAAARGTVVIVQDADLEYDPADIPRLIKPLVFGQADVVYGSRYLAESARGSSWIHQFGNRMLTRISNLATGLRLSDMETCYKAFRADVLSGLRLQQSRFGFEPEITAKIARRGARIVELPVSYQARDWQEGKKIGLRDGFAALYCILRYAWRD
jgi:glycosyltransferase involved in cell wall biosynthesis